jgi:hypothetical protein
MVRESISHRHSVLLEEEKIDLTELNRRVDVKLKDLIHHPNVDKVLQNLTTYEAGEPQGIHTLKEMLDNEAFLKDLIFDQAEVDRFNQECDCISEQTYNIAKEQVAKVETLAKEMEEHNAVMKVYTEKAQTLKNDL